MKPPSSPTFHAPAAGPGTCSSSHEPPATASLATPTNALHGRTAAVLADPSTSPIRVFSGRAFPWSPKKVGGAALPRHGLYGLAPRSDAAAGAVATARRSVRGSAPGREEGGGGRNALRLYHAAALTDPWLEHPAALTRGQPPISRLRASWSTSRPVRFASACATLRPRRARLRDRELTTQRFRERPRPPDQSSRRANRKAIPPRRPPARRRPLAGLSTVDVSNAPRRGAPFSRAPSPRRGQGMGVRRLAATARAMPTMMFPRPRRRRGNETAACGSHRFGTLASLPSAGAKRAA
jgi:hypothetical protein